MNRYLNIFIVAGFAQILCGCLGSSGSNVSGTLPSVDSGSNGTTPTLSTVLTYSANFKLAQNAAFSFTPSITGSTTYLASISPALPLGLQFSPLSGAITGTPTGTSAVQTYTVYSQANGVISSTTFTLLVDGSAPSAVVISDGNSQTNLTALSFSWTASTDAQSGIDHYEYAVATTTTGTNVVNWTSTTGTSVNLTGLSLTAGQVYYTRVRAINGAGLITAAVSDGFVAVGATGVQEGVWVAALYWGDNYYNYNSPKYCTTTGCPSIAILTSAYSNYLTVPNAGGNPSLLISSGTYGASANPYLCTLDSGCQVSSTLRLGGQTSSNDSYNIATADNQYLTYSSYGHGIFSCNITAASCSNLESGTTPSSGTILSANGGLWHLTSAASRFVNYSPFSVASSAVNLSISYRWTHPSSSSIWAITTSGATGTVRKCTSDGTCQVITTFTYTAGTPAFGSLVGGAGASGFWFVHNTVLRYCDNSSCTSILTGLPASTSAASFTNTLSGSSSWFKGTTGALYNCGTTGCTNLSLTAQTVYAAKTTDGLFAQVTSPTPAKMYYCTTSACSLLQSFTGDNSIPNTALDRTAVGLWLQTSPGYGTYYCTNSACSLLTGAPAGSVGSFFAARNSSKIWFIYNSQYFGHCTTSSCDYSTDLTSGDWTILGD